MSRKARNVKDLQRRSPKRDPYERILIVCEGSKTEPNYFNEIIDDLKLDTAEVEVDGDSGSSPRSVVKHAKKRYEEAKKRMIGLIMFIALLIKMNIPHIRKLYLKLKMQNQPVFSVL